MNLGIEPLAGKAVAVGNICTLPFQPTMSFLHLTFFDFIFDCIQIREWIISAMVLTPCLSVISQADLVSNCFVQHEEILDKRSFFSIDPRSFVLNAPQEGQLPVCSVQPVG